MTEVPDPFPLTLEEWNDIDMNENLRDVFNVLARMGFSFIEDEENAYGSNYAYITYDETTGSGKVDKFAGTLLRPRPDGAAYL